MGTDQSSGTVPTVSLPAPADTHEFGRRLATILRAGDLVLLSGPLGAGKTALAQGIGAGLGVIGAITSPTFVIARVHRPAATGGPALVHVDAYRLGAVTDPRGEVDALDLDASMDHAVTLVEWGEGMVEQLSDAYLDVRIERHDDETRIVRLVSRGGDWASRIAALEPAATAPGAGDVIAGSPTVAG